MKLVLAVIQDADAPALMRALAEHHFEATKLASTGGFLREGNTTLMLGVEDARLPDLKRLVAQTCRARTRPVPAPPRTGEDEETEAAEVAVGGAVCFVLGVQEFIKL